MRPLQRTVSISLVTLAGLLVGLTLAIAQGPAPADESFWQSIQTSTSAAEFRAYLEAFPKGFYADRARQRIAELESGRPDTTVPTPNPPTGTDIPFTPDSGPPRPAQVPQPPQSDEQKASVLTNYAVIREVQERLYALNYTVTVMNGQLSKETRDAISALSANGSR